LKELLVVKVFRDKVTEVVMLTLRKSVEVAIGEAITIAGSEDKEMENQ